MQFLRTLFLALVRPRHSVVTDPKVVVLYAGVSNVGDVVCITPAITAIKARFPDAKIHVIGKGKFDLVLKDHPAITGLHREQKTIEENAALIRGLSPSVAISFFRGYPELAALVHAGVPSIAAYIMKNGFRQEESRAYTILARLVYAVPYTPGEYVLETNNKLLGVMGIEKAPSAPTLGWTKEDEEIVLAQLKQLGVTQGTLIGIAPGGATAYRSWKPERFAVLADYMVEKHNLRPAFIGAGPDAAVVEEVLVHMKYKDRAVSFVNQSIGEMKALMPHLRMLVTNDSAPAQFARAFSVPVIVLAGPTDEREHHYSDRTNRIVVSPNRGAFQTGSANWLSVDRAKAEAQMDGIAVPTVIAVFDDLYKTLTM